MPSSEIVQASLSLTLFGPLQVRVQGILLPALRSRKSLWLLALLSLRANRPVEREWLAGMLWPDCDQSRAFANLRPDLSELRRALATEGKRLQSPDRHTLLLDLTDAEVDVRTFDAAIVSGTLPALEQAVALYRGPLLEGCTEEWVFQERTLREQNCLQALQTLGDSALSAGDCTRAVVYYRRAVSLDLWWETARRGWMEALAKSGDTNTALQVYREFVAFLKNDPKAVPDAQTTALYEQLREEVHRKSSPHTMLTTERHATPTVQGYLPHPLTELVGREDERLEVALQLRRSRLVTLTGMGGIGKTRMAREVANEVVREYKDGVWLVGLESINEGRLVILQIASVLGLREESGRTPLQRVTDYLRDKRLLLVLDNCEHLLEASAQVAAHLSQECGEIRILATSREALGITGETVWSVPALAVPEIEHLPEKRATLLRVLMGYESVQLFVYRAQAVQKTFELTGRNAPRVAEVCAQLEGIPLAIELAAARVRAMSVEQIAASLDNELSLLAGGNCSAQIRQQTLRATLDWSYALLTEAERLLLKRLSVFAGGCLLEAAEEVCRGESVEAREVLDLLTSLVDKSLVVFEEREGAGGRYRLLEMVRQYAAQGLHASGEAQQFKTHHRDWFLALAEEAEAELMGERQSVWLERLEAERANLRAALDWSAMEDQGAEAGLRLVGALSTFWEVRGYLHFGRGYLTRALSRAEASSPMAERAKALRGAGALAKSQGDYAAASALLEESLAIHRELGDRWGIARSLNSLGDVAYGQGDNEAARTLYEQSLAISQELGDKQGVSRSLNNLGIVARHQGNYVLGRTLHEESLAISRELGGKGNIAASLLFLGAGAWHQGDFDAARMLSQESLVIYRELGDKRGIAYSLYCQGALAYDQGNYEAASALLEESLAIHRELGDRWGIARSLNSLGDVAYGQGDNEAARTLYEQSLAISQELGGKGNIAASLLGLGTVAFSQGDYDAARMLCEQGMAIRRELGDKAGIAHSLYYLGSLALAQGDFDAARTLLQESLTFYRETGHFFLIHVLGLLGHLEREVRDYAAAAALYQECLLLRQKMGDVLHTACSLEDFAGLAGRQGHWERAVRLLGSAEALCETLGRTLPFAMLAEYERTVAASRAVLSQEAFAAAWEEGRAMTLEQAVAYAHEEGITDPESGS